MEGYKEFNKWDVVKTTFKTGGTDALKAGKKTGGAADASKKIDNATDASKKIDNAADEAVTLTSEQSKKIDELLKKDEKTLWQTIKSNPKYTLAGITAASLATYMIVNGITNPAEAAGKMVGDVGKGAAGGILDGLGLGFMADYLPYMSLCCSAFMFMFMFLYMFKTFLH